MSDPDTSPDPAKELAEREARIRAALVNSYYVTGLELYEIRKKQLYNSSPYRQLFQLTDPMKSFGAYYEKVWGKKPARASQVIKAALFAREVYNCKLPLPLHESHIRPLLRHLKDKDDPKKALKDQIEVWRRS
jgi:hypothetical protein